MLLSRATRHEDLLLMRAPRIEFFLAGPPAGLLDAIKVAKQKPPKPAAAAPIDLFAELRRTATRVE